MDNVQLKASSQWFIFNIKFIYLLYTLIYVGYKQKTTKDLDLNTSSWIYLDTYYWLGIVERIPIGHTSRVVRGPKMETV